MKHSLILSLCAVALAVSAFTTAQAQTVTLSLDLFYSDPSDTNSAGTWQLYAKTDGANEGLSGVSVQLTGLASALASTPVFMASDGSTGWLDNIGTVNWDDDADSSDTTLDMVFGQVQTTGGIQNLVYDNGKAGGTSPFDDLLNDVVDTSGANMDDALFLAFGKFAGGDDPNFGGVGANVWTTQPVDPNVAGDVAEATVVTQIRDNTDTLAGDANLDKTVNGFDIDELAPNFGGAGPFTWQQGDFTGDFLVNGFDIDLLAPNFGSTAPLTVNGGVVPEPTAMVLASGAILGLIGLRRRS